MYVCLLTVVCGIIRQSITRFANNIGVKQIVRFPHFSSVFVHMKYTSNKVACNDDDVIDVTAPHV